MKNFVSLLFDKKRTVSKKIAVIDENATRRTSWKELYVKTCSVAAYASARGWHGVIPVCMPRSVEAVEALLGLALAGIGIAPLSDHTPEARIRLIEEQSGNSVFTRETYDAAVQTPCESFEPVDFGYDSPAYIVYTSGSTGMPKGVMLSNDTVVKSYRRMASDEFLSLRNGDLMLQHASFSFVALMIDLFAPLYKGCILHILPEEARTDIDLMTAYINKHGITATFFSPKHLARLGDVPTLRVIVAGGERVANLGPKGYKLINCWGMSETAALATGFTIEKPMENTPIGKSRGDFRCYILDDDGNLADEGELCVSGATAFGYYKRPDLTATTFVTNPFCDEEGHRLLLHTGDIVRRLPDGNLLYLNRKDFMIKINGQRVEPGEAESVIARIPGIKAVAVKGFTEEDGHTYLCAYYVSGGTVSEDTVRGYLMQNLPAYMVPAFYRELDELPLNANAKLDRSALKAPEAAQLHFAYVAPQNERERALCEGFESVLRSGKAGIDDDFFRLGGDSIRAMTLVSRLNLPGLNTAAVFAGRTPRRIAELMEAQSEDALFTALPRGNERMPLTDSQMGIFLECADAPASIKYNIPFSFGFGRPAGMSAEAVKRCVDSVIALHPALLGHIGSEGDTFFLSRDIMPAEGICVACEAESFDEASAWDGFVQPFALGQGPLVRAKALLTGSRVQILMDCHHTVADGTSVSVLVKDILCALTGEMPSAEKVDAFALYDAQQQLLSSGGESAKNYFDMLLGGVETDSNLLPDRKSTLTDAPAGRLVIPVRDLDLARVRRASVTESTFFMGVFGYTLAKMTGQNESLFAVAESGRKNAALDTTVGMLVKTLPVYMRIDETKSALTQLAALQKQFFDSLGHDCIGFGTLSRTYGVTSDVMFVYQGDLLTGCDSALGHTDIVMRPTGSAISNLNAAVFRAEGGHDVVLEYRADLYDAATAERFGELFLAAARAFSADMPLNTLTLLGENDRAFLDGLNQTDLPFNADETMVDIFRRHAKEHPDKACVLCEDRSYTYREADGITERIAAYVHKLGIGKGRTVSVLIPRSEYMIFTGIGVMKAGAMYQPLDPSYPPERLAYMQKDADAALLIADRSLISLVPEYTGPVLYTDEIAALPAADCAIEPPTPEDGFILLYTSGTTGLPKGCMLKHRNLTALTRSYSEVTGMDFNAIAAAYASFGFDAHMADLYPVLSNGGTSVIIPDAIRLELAAIRDYCEARRVSHLILTTQLCVQFVLQFKELTYLKCIMAGGEKMVSLEPPRTYRLINAYGPTECTVLETAFTVDKVYDDIPIGTALPNTRLYVVDPFNRRLPVGVPGELVIAGPQVACGYINRPEQTAKAFVSNTFEPAVPAEYARCYRTGDVVRFTNDGQMMFIGRRDMQVKIRGFRIELSEVERVIMDYPGVKTATVIAVEAPTGGKCLNAYVVGDAPIDIGALHAYIRSVKPPYMVPAATMQLDALPLTVNGKVDKRKLPRPEMHFDDVTKPETELGRRIFDAAAQAVGTDAFGIRTDLFEAGLSSLGSITLCSLLATEFGIPVQMRNLKKYPTVEKLEGFIAESLAGADNAKAPVNEVPAVAYGQDHPISKTMEGIFTECAAKPESTFYNIPYLIKLAPSVDAERLKQALAAAVEAHPYMKTELFTDADGRIRQHRRTNDTFTVSDIRALSAARIGDIRDSLVRPFAITGGRLFDITLIRADGLYLLLDFHHIIADGTSMNLFLKDVERAYAGETLREETYTGFDMAEDEQKARAGEDLADAKEYFAQLLDGQDKSFLPLPDKYPSQPPASGKLTYTLTSVDPEKVRAFCEKNRVTLNAFFVSAFGLLLGRYAGADTPMFNTVYNGRNDSRTENTFAMLVKTLPVVCHTDKQSAREVAQEMTKQLLGSMTNDLFSYAEIAHDFGIANDVMFIYQGAGFDRDTFCGGKAEEIELDLSEGKTALSLQVMLKNNAAVCELEYDPQRYTEKLMRAFLSAYDMACAGFAADKKLSELNLLSAAAEAEMERFNDSARPYDQTATITGLFLAQAKAHPDKPCVVYKNRRVTYAEAEVFTGKLARFLMEHGIGLNDTVPILIERDEKMLLTANGVVRAGAAYLGLDPTYPADRLAFMISDSGAKYLIAERALAGSIPGYTGPVLYTDEIDALPAMTEEQERAFRTDARFAITPENNALVVYSSGTTGLPKGSVLQHKAVVAYFHNYVWDLLADETSNVASYASFGFDGGAQDAFCPPMAGGTVFVIPDDIRLDLKELESFYVRNAITNGFMTTQVGTMFISATKCRTLRSFMVGGEKLIPVTGPDWVRFYNGYGPSETLCYVNRYAVTDTGSLQPIGSVSANIKEYIVDKHFNRLPYGACGELCIAGLQMGRGYLNRPEKTASVFVNNPFCNEEGYRTIYRTGDVARLLPDGNYDFVGRNDGQVKIRGFRVELGEVEERIRKFPGVKNTVVTAFDNPAGGKYLAAYIVTEGSLDTEALKAFIAAEKPAYMVPAAMMQLDEIPLTSNGKVNLKKLPAIELGARKKNAEPANEMEETVCHIFGEVLGLDKVYADDDFFSIGGSSISAIQVIVKCEQAGMPVVYKNLFANPTAQKLVQFLTGDAVKDTVASDFEKGDGHNYAALAYNVPENLPQLHDGGLGDVLLTGVTGFLGSHVFRELLTCTDGRVICLVRGKNGMTAQQRLEMMMVYYFEEWFADSLKDRVTVVDGDMEDDAVIGKLKQVKFDTIINCAANVKHFAAGNELMGANFNGVENLIALAEQTGAKLIQISSLSVCGESVNDSVPAGYLFRETDLNIGQSLENRYVHSKYLAEQAVIDAVSNGRIRGKIIRLGNLMARFGDSEFQLNAGTNGFLRMFIGFAALGCFPIGLMDSEIEFSPIDAVAKAVVLLSGTPDGFTVFHAKNCNTIHLSYFISAIRRKARPIEIVSDAEFDARLESALASGNDLDKLGGLLSYRNGTDASLEDTLKFHDADDSGREIRVKIGSDTSFTVKALYRLGFAWPLISEEYLDKMVEALFEMNYFTGGEGII